MVVQDHAVPRTKATALAHCLRPYHPTPSLFFFYVSLDHAETLDDVAPA